MNDSIQILLGMLVNPGSVLGLQINIVISVITGVMLCWLLYLNVVVTKEKQAVQQVRHRARTFRHSVQKGQVEQGGRQAEYVLTDTLLQGIDRARLIYKRVIALVHVRRTSPDVIDSLDKIDMSQAQVKLAIPRYVASIPVLLGLVGTLWGLSYTVTQILPLVEEINDPKELMALVHPMTAALGGMKTAFTTTVCGLLASLLLTLVVTGTAKRYQALLGDLESTYVFDLTPILVPSDEASARVAFIDSLNESAERLANTSHYMNNLATNLATAASQTHEGQDKIFQTASLLKASVEGLQDLGPTALERLKALENMLLGFKQSANELSVVHQGVGGLIEEAQSVLKQVEQLVRNSELERKQEQNQYEKALELLSHKVTSLFDDWVALAKQRNLENAEHISEQLEKMLQAARQPFVDFFDDFSLHTRDEITRQLNDYFAQLNTTGDGVVRKAEALKKQVTLDVEEA